METKVEAKTTSTTPQTPLADTEAAGGHPDTWTVEKQIEHMEEAAHRQRLSGVRVRVVNTGCYYLYGADGRSLGNTTYPTPFWGYTEEELKTTALRVAFSEELLVALTAIAAEVGGSARPYSTDSYLPAHLLDAARAAIAKATGAA